MVAELVVPCAFALPQRHVELLAAAVMAGSAGGSFELVATWPLCGFFLDIRRTAPHRGSDQLVNGCVVKLNGACLPMNFPHHVPYWLPSCACSRRFVYPAHS